VAAICSGADWATLGRATPGWEAARCLIPRGPKTVESSTASSSISDAVFAIAITLLVLDIRVPEIPERLVVEQLPQRLYELRPKYLSYVLSFVVILMYWMAHHSTFRAIRCYDRVLIWLNSLFLMCIAFLPFPTSLLGEYGDH
jgi:uncharacterized membrane protein